LQEEYYFCQSLTHGNEAGQGIFLTDNDSHGNGGNVLLSIVFFQKDKPVSRTGDIKLMGILTCYRQK